MLRIFSALIFTATLAAYAGDAGAGIIWSWSANGGAEQGRIVTDGALVGGSAAAASYAITDFVLDTTSYAGLGGAVGGSLSDGTFFVTVGGNKLQWDGISTATFSNNFAPFVVFFTSDVTGPFAPNGAGFSFQGSNDLEIYDPADFVPDDTYHDRTVSALANAPEPSSLSLTLAPVLVGAFALRWRSFGRRRAG